MPTDLPLGLDLPTHPPHTHTHSPHPCSLASRPSQAPGLLLYQQLEDGSPLGWVPHRPVTPARGHAPELHPEPCMRATLGARGPGRHRQMHQFWPPPIRLSGLWARTHPEAPDRPLPCKHWNQHWSHGVHSFLSVPLYAEHGLHKFGPQTPQPALPHQAGLSGVRTGPGAQGQGQLCPGHTRGQRRGRGWGV